MASSSRDSEVLQDLKTRFGEAITEASVQRRGRVTFKVSKDRTVDVAFHLRDRLDFDHIASVSGVDYLSKKEFEVIYHVWSTSRKTLAAMRTSVSRDQPTLPSLTQVWEGANFHERETHEMFGINFEGHPNPALLLLPEDWNANPPLRRDFLLRTKFE